MWCFHGLALLVGLSFVGSSVASKRCWENEKYLIIRDCHECTNDENSKYQGHCEESGFIETLQCMQSGEMHRSCENPMIGEARKFWWFELISALMACLALTVVFIRVRALDAEHEERINKQISTL